MSWFSDIFSWISCVLKKIWKVLGPILVICAILFVAFAPLLVFVFGVGTTFAATAPVWLAWIAPLVSGAAGLGWAGAIAAGLGLAYVIDADTTTEMLNTAVDGVTSVASNVASGVGEVTGSFVDSLFSSSGILLLGGIACLILLSRKKDETSPTVVQISEPEQTPSNYATDGSNTDLEAVLND